MKHFLKTIIQYEFKTVIISDNTIKNSASRDALLGEGVHIASSCPLLQLQDDGKLNHQLHTVHSDISKSSKLLLNILYISIVALEEK